MEQKYKAGDVVHVRLGERSASDMNQLLPMRRCDSDIIAHIPAPEPVVRWIQVYEGGHTSGLRHRKPPQKTGVVFVLRLEWPDGDMSKPLLDKNVTMEEV